MALLVTNRSYRLLFSAAGISNLGDGIAAVALPWLASLMTRDPLLIALVAFAQRIPWLLLSIPVGVLTDRMDRRVLMVRADMVRVGVTAGILGLIFSTPDRAAGTAPVLALAALALLLGCAEVVRDNAAQTVLPSIVSKSDLERANGQMWSIEEIAGSFVGPPLAGVLIAWAVPLPFAVDAVAFALAAWLVWIIALPPRTPQPKRSLWIEALDGWRWMHAHPVILRLAVVLGLLNALSMMVMSLLVLFAQDVLGLGAVAYGLMLTAGALGGVIGGLGGPWVVARLGPQRSLYGALLIMTLPYFVIAATGTPLVVAAGLLIGMTGGMVWNVVTVSYRQRRIPDALLGRVNSIYRCFGWGMMPVGILFGGLIVSWIEPSIGRDAALRLPIWISAVGHAAVLIYSVSALQLPQD